MRRSESFHVPRKTSSRVWDDDPRLIPGLPDETSLQILARIPRIRYLSLKAVSRSWKAAVTSPEIYNTRKQLGTTEEWVYIVMNKGLDGRFLHALDPISKTWQRLPPVIPNRSCKIEHRTCAFAAVDGCLYMLGGVSGCSSLTSVWKYDPVSNSWIAANPMSVGRAYFETGVLNNKLFVVGGISFSRVGGDNLYSETPLQSAEVFDPEIGLWSDIPSMPCSKANPTAFLEGSHDLVRIGLASYRGKLYVPQRFSSVGGGEVYDPETNLWMDMPTGMAEGWPPCFGTNQSVIVDGDLYALYRGLSSEDAKVYLYNHHDASWKVVVGYVPLHDKSRYMLMGLLGKLHVVTKDDNDNIIVMRADKRDDSTASLDERDSESVTTSESYIWNVIASRNFGFGILEGCQNLDI
ncbi:putative F-box domain, kelch-type beta propeller, F-box-like domain superfamily [Helianthus annuus]|nr:putative F-box domain, kelch-type beta propeller, F-box-like domain superfamily [Helianthus annuus]KAJ0752669.1 putative F-box domain, kelch-type beta propeller, F-box-like domain superfamily [Helianthus annuus]